MATYFLFVPSGSLVKPLFWRRLANFASLPIHINLNLLGHAVGDDPASIRLPTGARLVPTTHYRRFSRTGAGGVFIPDLQPFAFVDRNKRIQAMDIGPRLKAFLDDPLGGGERMNLSLPFYDENIKLGTNGGGWVRPNNNNEKFYHGGTDFNTSSGSVFDVCAAASGKVLKAAGGCMVLSHTTPSHREFRTIYQHLDLTSAGVEEGNDVRRGQFLARTDPAVDPVHLHFGVAVQAGSAASAVSEVNGINISDAWYFIDPWGVYNVRANNYLPTSGQIFESEIRGAVHTIQWSTQPLFKTIPTARRTSAYKQIVRLQARVREGSNFGGTLPEEQDQFLIWLKGDPGFFSVPISRARDRTMELELVTLLRNAFFNRRKVRVEFRYVGDLRLIMAAWVRD